MSLLFRAIRKVLPEPALPLARRVHSYLRRVEAGLARGWGVLVVRFHWHRLSSGLATPGHLAPGRRKLLSHADSSTAQDPDLSRSAINNTESRKPHILFVMQKWCYCLPACGPTNHEHNLVGSLEASGLATYERFYFDEYYQQHGTPCDAAFLKLCMASEADLIVLIRVPVRASDPDPPNVKLETMRLIKERIGIPIIGVWPDTVLLHEAQVAESCLAFVSFNVVWDSASAYLKTTRKPELWLPTWTPEDTRIYYDAGLKRDIDVSFVGGLKYFPDRKSGLAALRSGGISVLHAGGQRENRLSVEEYASIHKRSKIGLNFCLTPDKQIQCKGRVFEILLCGAMLLEAENPETARFLDPMVEYVPFRDEADLVEKARFFLNNESKRLEIADKGHRKAMERYTGERFWRTILDAVFPDLRIGQHTGTSAVA